MAIRSDKKIVEDIVPNSRRTIRNISLEEESTLRAGARTRLKKELREDIEEDDGIKIPLRTRKMKEELLEEDDEPIRVVKNKKNRRFSGIIITFVVIFVCVAVIAVALSLFYSKAVITVKPKIAPIEVNGTFTAKKVPGLKEIAYEIVKKEDESSVSVTAKNGPLVETKSKGSIYLYNEQTKTQTIVAGTRLSNNEGLIYRTSSTISIPAGKVSSGKVVPGSISVAIVADKAGEEYNMLLSEINLTDTLKVVAYRGGDKYNLVYGRIKTDVAGGFLGNKKIVSPEDQKIAIENAQKSLKEKLTPILKSSIESGSILYDNAVVFEFKSSEPSGENNNQAIITVKAKAYGLVFKEDDLLKFIGAKELEQFPVKSYKTEGLNSLNFVIVNTKDFSAQKENSLIFNLKGKLSLIGTFEEKALKEELRGIELSESNAVFAKYPAIGSAHAMITPFWMRSFPSSEEKIIIDVQSE